MFPRFIKSLSSFISIWPNLKLKFARELRNKSFLLAMLVTLVSVGRQSFIVSIASKLVLLVSEDPWEKVLILISLFLCVTRLSSRPLLWFCSSLSYFLANPAQFYFDPAASCCLAIASSDGQKTRLDGCAGLVSFWSKHFWPSLKSAGLIGCEIQNRKGSEGLKFYKLL